MKRYLAILLAAFAAVIAVAQPTPVTGVSRIVAGTNITISPSNGQGKVTINSSGGGGSGTVTSVSVATANGVSGSVATATTTPAITLTLGDITPSSISIGADPADAGDIRLVNAGIIGWEASPAGTDVTLSVNSSEQFVFSNAILSPTLITPALGTPASGVATNLTGTASSLTAGNATNVGVTDDNTTNATMYPVWVTATTGNLPARVSSTGLNFNPSTAMLTLTGPAQVASLFIGNTTSTITGAAGNMTITAGTGNSRTMSLRTTTAGGTATTFLTGDASQNTTLAGNLTLGASTSQITGAAGNMTILSGTGASRTMILQTTTAGSAATTALTLGADQSATIAGNGAVAGASVSSSSGFVFPVGTTALSSFRIPHGAAPTSPVNGDFWTTSAGGLFGRINGATINYGAAGAGTVSVVGAGSLTSTAIVTGGGTTTLQTPSATATMDSSGNITTPGTVTTGNAGGTSGAVTISGTTNGSTKYTTADATAQAVIVSTAAQTTGGSTLTIPDQAGTNRNFVFDTLAQTETNKTFTAPVINGATSASGNFDLSGSSGTFKSNTGANQLSGAVTVTDATTPSVTLASGKTNTGFFQVNGKTSGSLKIIAADAAAQAVTITLAAQTTGSSALTLPDMAGAAGTFAFINKAQTWTGVQSFTSPDITTSVTTPSTSFTAWAGATTLLTIGGTGASASSFFPSTLDATTSTTGAIRTSGGISAAKALNIGTTGTFGSTVTGTTFTTTGSGAGAFSFTQGTTQSTGTTNITLQAPTGVTSYIITLPTAVGATGLMQWTVASTVATLSSVTTLPSALTIPAPVFSTGATASGSGNFNLSGSTGSFSLPTGGLLAPNSSLPNRFRSASSVSAQAPSASTRTYVTGSDIGVFTAAQIQVGTIIEWDMSITKTGAGVASSTFDIAFGTAGSTADTARVSFTKPAGVGNVDTCHVHIAAVVKTNSASGVVLGDFVLTDDQTGAGGFLASGKYASVLQVQSSTFDTTTPTHVGICITTGASDAYTINYCTVKSWNL